MSKKVNVPPFLVHNPALWFQVVEAEFTQAGVSDDQMKFNYVIINLEPLYFDYIRDLMRNLPISDRYKSIKDELIRSLDRERESVWATRNDPEQRVTRSRLRRRQVATIHCPTS